MKIVPVKLRDIRGARLTIVSIRTAEQVSAVFPGKRIVGSLNWERERREWFEQLTKSIASVGVLRLERLNHWEGEVRTALVFFSLILLCGQPAHADDKDKLIGAWKIVSAVVEDVQTHEQKPLYGEHPKGYLILLATGHDVPSH